MWSLYLRCHRCSSWPVVAALALVVSLVLAGCGNSANGLGHRAPEWLFEWQPPAAGVSADKSAEVAYAASAYVLHRADPTVHKPVQTTWLATGPTYGLAVVQLDPADQYVDIAELYVQEDEEVWQGGGGTLRSGSACSHGLATYASLNFVEPVCQTGTGFQVPRSLTSYYGTVTGWYSDSAVFVLDHVVADLDRPGVAEPVALGGVSGWLLQSGTVTTITLRLGTKEWLVTGCSWPLATCRALTVEALTSVDELVPLHATLPS